MRQRNTEPSREGGREGAERLSPELCGDAATPQRNRSGSRSLATNLLDIRTHLVAIEEVLMSLGRVGLIDDELLRPLKLLRQRGFRRGR